MTHSIQVTNICTEIAITDVSVTEFLPWIEQKALEVKDILTFVDEVDQRAVLSELQQRFHTFMNAVMKVTSEKGIESRLRSNAEKEIRGRHIHKLFLIPQKDIISFISDDSKEVRKGIANKYIDKIALKEIESIIIEVLEKMDKKMIVKALKETLLEEGLELSENKIFKILGESSNNITHSFINTYFPQWALSSSKKRGERGTRMINSWSKIFGKKTGDNVTRSVDYIKKVFNFLVINLSNKNWIAHGFLEYYNETLWNLVLSAAEESVQAKSQRPASNGNSLNASKLVHSSEVEISKYDKIKPLLSELENINTGLDTSHMSLIIAYIKRSYNTNKTISINYIERNLPSINAEKLTLLLQKIESYGFTLLEYDDIIIQQETTKQQIISIFNKPEKTITIHHESTTLPANAEYFKASDFQPYYKKLAFNKDFLEGFSKTFEMGGNPIAITKIHKALSTPLANWRLMGNKFHVYNIYGYRIIRKGNQILDCCDHNIYERKRIPAFI